MATPSHTIQPALTPPDTVQALLFDCDGTLLDTLGVYQESWRGPFARRGFVITDEWFHARAGLAMDPFILAALPHLDLAGLRQVEREGMESFFEQLGSVERVEHVVDRLGLPPGHVLAYEDSDAGLAAARAAGVHVIDVRGT